MKPHTLIYMEYFGYKPGDFIPCEITGRPGADVQHLDPRGMGGNPSKDKDKIENLMATVRNWHTFLEQNPTYYWWFQNVHLRFMETRTPYYLLDESNSDITFKEIIQKIAA